MKNNPVFRSVVWLVAFIIMAYITAAAAERYKVPIEDFMRLPSPIVVNSILSTIAAFCFCKCMINLLEFLWDNDRWGNPKRWLSALNGGVWSFMATIIFLIAVKWFVYQDDGLTPVYLIVPLAIMIFLLGRALTDWEATFAGQFLLVMTVAACAAVVASRVFPELTFGTIPTSVIQWNAFYLLCILTSASFGAWAETMNDDCLWHLLVWGLVWLLCGALLAEIITPLWTWWMEHQVTWPSTKVVYFAALAPLSIYFIFWAHENDTDSLTLVGRR